MNYAIEQRLRMIDFLLSHYDYINRSVIMDYFGIGAAQVTRDFAQYKKLAPENLVYNPVERIYYKTKNFKALYENP